MAKPVPNIMGGLVVKEFVNSKSETVFIPSVLYGATYGKEIVDLEAYDGSLKCPICNQAFPTAKDIMLHCLGHLERVISRSTFLLTCKYCLKDFKKESAREIHEQTVHLLKDVKHCCHICERKFDEMDTWGAHMNEVHIEGDMPYICQVCDYRSSLRTDLIDHFYTAHGTSKYVICTYCLKTLEMKSNSDITKVFVHLNYHRLKRNTKCQKCVLVFPSQQDVDGHAIMHSNPEIKSWLSEIEREVLNISEGYNPNQVYLLYVPTPGESERPSTSTGAGKEKKSYMWVTMMDGPMNFGNKENLDCLECKEDMQFEGHFEQHLCCSNCKYSTCCRGAMASHVSVCLGYVQSRIMKFVCGINKLRSEVLEIPLRCKCGFSSRQPDNMAEHVQQCKEKIVICAESSSKPSDVTLAEMGEMSNSVTKSLQINVTKT